MKRRSFLGLLAGVFVAPKLGLPAQELATVIPEPVIEPAVASFYSANNVFSTRIWAKALERDIFRAANDMYFGGDVGEMSSVVIINRPADFTVSA